MMRFWMQSAGSSLLAIGCLCAVACGKPTPTTSAAPVAARAPAQAESAASANAAGNVTAQPSEWIATNTADPNCPSCVRPDASSGSEVQAKALDPVFRDDLKLTIAMTCELLEDGVGILEKHAKEPAAAKGALLAYREKNKARISELGIKTRDMAVRLKALGFESEVPEEVRTDYEERMAKALARLEAVRAVYAKHQDVLEALGPFIRVGE